MCGKPPAHGKERRWQPQNKRTQPGTKAFKNPRNFVRTGVYTSSWSRFPPWPPSRVRWRKRLPEIRKHTAAGLYRGHGPLRMHATLRVASHACGPHASALVSTRPAMLATAAEPAVTASHRLANRSRSTTPSSASTHGLALRFAPAGPEPPLRHAAFRQPVPPPQHLALVTRVRRRLACRLYLVNTAREARRLRRCRRK